MSGFKLGGMTIGSVFKKPETLLYPFEQKQAPAGLRGHVIVDLSMCVFCGICQKRCPADAIAVDKAAGTWAIDDFACVQCACCVKECPKNCLLMEPSPSAVGTSKAPRVFVVGSMR
ncbi:MAG: 4Fe-4S binding protein [Eggerthellaceae bacterium]|nr:4Fe-4S binding protein [Eggerthellaceae bacterium]